MNRKINIKELILPTILLLFYIVIMQITVGTVCPLKGFFNIRCPACGLTHATIYFFSGNMALAFQSNPTFPLWLLSIALFFIDRYIHPLKFKPFPVLFIITGLVTLFVYICSFLKY